MDVFGEQDKIYCGFLMLEKVVDLLLSLVTVATTCYCVILEIYLEKNRIKNSKNYLKSSSSHNDCGHNVVARLRDHYSRQKLDDSVIR